MTWRLSILRRQWRAEYQAETRPELCSLLTLHGEGRRRRHDEQIRLLGHRYGRRAFRPERGRAGRESGIDVTAAQLSQLSYQSGLGADTLWVAAYDGQLGQLVEQLHRDRQGRHRPDRDGSNVTRRVARALQLLAVHREGRRWRRDHEYAFWDRCGGGHLVLNGVAQGVRQEIDVTAAQFSH